MKIVYPNGMRGLKMNRKKVWITITLGIMVTGFVFFLTSSSTLATSFVQTVNNPENQEQVDDIGQESFAPPWLVPPNETFYTELTRTEYRLMRDSIIASIDVSQLERLENTTVTRITLFSSSEEPVDIDSIEDENLREVLENNPISWHVLSSLRFETDSGVVTISVSQPSSAAQEIPVLLGNEKVNLANETEAWFSKGMADEDGQNRVTFVHQNVIITIAGSLEPDQLKSIAENTDITLDKE